MPLSKRIQTINISSWRSQLSKKTKAYKVVESVQKLQWNRAKTKTYLKLALLRPITFLLSLQWTYLLQRLGINRASPISPTLTNSRHFRLKIRSMWVLCLLATSGLCQRLDIQLRACLTTTTSCIRLSKNRSHSSEYAVLVVWFRSRLDQALKVRTTLFQ